MRVRTRRIPAARTFRREGGVIEEAETCGMRWIFDVRMRDGHRSSLLSMSQRAPQINTAAVATPATSRERSAGSEACSQIISRKSRAASASNGGVERMERRMVATRMSCAHNRLGHGNPALEDI